MRAARKFYKYNVTYVHQINSFVSPNNLGPFQADGKASEVDIYFYNVTLIPFFRNGSQMPRLQLFIPLRGWSDQVGVIWLD